LFEYSLRKYTFSTKFESNAVFEKKILDVKIINVSVKICSYINFLYMVS